MAGTTYYSTGTVSVNNGGTTVTGVGTAWAGVVFKGDLFVDPAQGIVARVTADAVSNTSLSINAWPGTTMSGDAYEILFTSDAVRASERARQLLEQLSAIDANGRGLFYLFDDSTTDADPGAGNLRLNNATIASATAAYADNLDANGATVSTVISTWDDAGSITNRGQLWLRQIADPSIFHAFNVTGSVVDGTGYRKLTLSYIGGSGAFSDADEIMVQFVPVGAQGQAFTYSAEADDPAGLTAYEGEADGYRVFVVDLGATEFGSYAGRSGVVEWNGSDTWTLIALYTGPKGDQGNQGWAPQLVAEADGARRVFKLSGYVGGEGTAPTANVGDYLKADGTFTETIGEAADVRGAAGVSYVWRSAYSGGTAYAANDTVRDQGASWIALQATTGNAPPTLPTTANAFWELMAAKGADGAGTVAGVLEGTGITVDATDSTQPVVALSPGTVTTINSKITMGKAIAAALIMGG
jgi:hypothetical protein